MAHANGSNSNDAVAGPSKAVNGTALNGNLDAQDTPPKTASMDRELFEQAKRQKMLREQEEKIPVFIQEPETATNPALKKDEEEIPQMSATSYPGQEWNPYGEFDWED